MAATATCVGESPGSVSGYEYMDAQNNLGQETVQEDIDVEVDVEGPSAEDTAVSELSASDQQVLAAANAWEDAFGWEKTTAGEFDQLNIQQTIQAIGGAVVAIALITVVVNEVLTTNAISNSSGPFSGVIDSLNSTGVAAMSLLVVGLLVAAGMRIMGMMGGGGF